MHSRFIDKKVAVLGFGLEGTSAVSYLLSRGASVYVFDEQPKSHFDDREVSELEAKGTVFHFGAIPELHTFDVIVRSPGVPLTAPSLMAARDRGVIISSATKLFFDECPCPIIGVTGTKGKGTTSTLIYEILKAADKHVFLGGNIGVPALDFLDQLNSESMVVLELSSFQLIDLDKSPHISVMLMVTSEHLDYHKDVYEYVEAKRNILKFQQDADYAVINRDYPASRESDIYTNGKVLFFSREDEVEEGAFIRNEAVFVTVNGVEGKIIDIKDIVIPGTHNLENVMAAVMASLLAGAGVKPATQVLKQFKGLEHRLELVREVGGVRFYDDSFSTTPETAMAAIEAFEEPKILILGGSSKNSNFTALGELINSRDSIKAIVGIGNEWKRIKQLIRNERIQFIEGKTTMSEIVKASVQVAESGDVILLSPACASFDMFKDYKDRGDQFKSMINKL